MMLMCFYSVYEAQPPNDSGDKQLGSASGDGMGACCPRMLNSTIRRASAGLSVVFFLVLTVLRGCDVVLLFEFFFDEMNEFAESCLLDLSHLSDVVAA